MIRKPVFCLQHEKYSPSDCLAHARQIGEDSVITRWLDSLYDLVDHWAVTHAVVEICTAEKTVASLATSTMSCERHHPIFLLTRFVYFCKLWRKDA
jgi:hypothetical protein